jgi:hypothetical protein
MRYRGESYLRTISIASILIHPGRGSPGSVSPLMSFDEQCEDDVGLRLELRGELLEQEEDNTGSAEGKRESGALGEL